MAINNPNFLKLQAAISPIVSIGVGSSICTVCSKQGVDPNKIEDKIMPLLKTELVKYYEKFWNSQLDQIKSALASVK
jgi:hypothetical protein